MESDHGRQREAAPEAPAARAPQAAGAAPAAGPLNVERVLALQATAGNAAVARMLQRVPGEAVAGSDEQRTEEQIGERERLLRERGDARLLEYWAEVRRAIEDFGPWARDRVAEMPTPPEPSLIEQALSFCVGQALSAVPYVGTFLSMGWEALDESATAAAARPYTDAREAALAVSGQFTRRVAAGADAGVAGSRRRFHDRLRNDAILDDRVRGLLRGGSDAQMDEALAHYGLRPVAEAGIYAEVMRGLMRQFLRWRAERVYDLQPRDMQQRVQEERSGGRERYIRQQEGAADRQAAAAVEAHGAVGAVPQAQPAAPAPAPAAVPAPAAAPAAPAAAAGGTEAAITERLRTVQARGDGRILQYWTEIRRAVEDFQPWGSDRIAEMPAPPEPSMVVSALDTVLGEAIGSLGGHLAGRGEMVGEAIFGAAYERLEMPARETAAQGEQISAQRTAAQATVQSMTAHVRRTSDSSVRRARAAFHRRLQADATGNGGVRGLLADGDDMALDAILEGYGMMPLDEMRVYETVIRSMMRDFMRWRAERVYDLQHRDMRERLAEEVGGGRRRYIEGEVRAGDRQATAAVREHGAVGAANR